MSLCSFDGKLSGDILPNRKDEKLLDQNDKHECGPVHYAASGEYASNVNVIHELITRNKKELNHSSFNVGSLNLLHLAIRADNFHMVDYLVTVCPSLLNRGKPLPLDYAQAIGNKHIVNRIEEVSLKDLDR